MEPTDTISEEVLELGEQNEGVLTADIKLPFVVDREENAPMVSVGVSDKPDDTSLVELKDLTVSNVDKESETCVLSCSLSVDTDELHKMKELPLIQIEVKTNDGFKSHRHCIKLEKGIVSNLTNF